MATDWAAEVKKYVATADDAAIAGLVRYCGIALRNRDSALVSFSDKAETDRVRTNFLKKKLGLTQADSVLDAAIAKVGVQMKTDRTKNRVTVYYLLASEFKQLGLFVKAAPAAKKAPAAKAAAPAKAAPVKAAVKPAAGKTAAAKPAATKPATAAKAAGVAAVVAGAAAAKAKPAKAAPTTKAPAAKAPAAPVKKAVAAAPAKKAAAPAKATTTKAAAPAANATQGLLDKAATSASDAAKAAPKVAAAAAAGTVAAIGAAAAGAAHIAKDGAAKAGNTASAATGAVADKASAMMSGGAKPAATTAAAADDGSEMNWLWWVIGLAVIALVAWFVFGRGPDDETNGTEAAASAAASEVGTDLAAAAPEGSVSIPAGAGVTSEMRDGKPVVKVYFDSGMTSVTPDFANTAGGLKSWLDTHSGAVLEVSGYSDPSGNAAANAELSKQRAQAVQSALMAVDIPATSAKLVKPAEVSDATVAKEAARRVEVVVK